MKLIHASISENNNNGLDGKSKIGDQTGKEVCIRSWYEKPWEYVLRYYDSNVAKKVVSVATQLANSNYVGYSQKYRNSLYKELEKCDFDVNKYIASKVFTETDCSAFVYAVFSCFVPDMRSNSNAPTTNTMLKFFGKHGFEVLSEKDYTTGKKLITGDIVVKPKSHTAIVLKEEEIIIKKNLEVDYALTVLARDVITGNWGNGEDRKDKLYRAVQDKVKELL